MNLSNELCNIQITVDETYSVESTDNRHYDIELNPNGYGHDDLYKVFSIHIDLYDRELDIALVGSFYAPIADCAVLNNNILTVLQNHSISQIDITNGTLCLFKKIECFGTTFGIYEIKDGYIIWGEIDIIRLNSSFEQLWVFGGKDIFVSQTGKQAFRIDGQKIILNDWEDNYYELDFEGKQNLFIPKQM